MTLSLLSPTSTQTTHNTLSPEEITFNTSPLVATDVADPFAVLCELDLCDATDPFPSPLRNAHAVSEESFFEQAKMTAAWCYARLLYFQYLAQQWLTGSKVNGRTSR